MIRAHPDRAGDGGSRDARRAAWVVASWTQVQNASAAPLAFKEL